MTREYARYPATPMPISSSAWSTLTAAMIQRGTLKDCRSPGMTAPLRRPAPLRRAARDFVERPPSFIGGHLGLVDGAAHVSELADEIVELRLDLRPHPRAA